MTSINKTDTYIEEISGTAELIKRYNEETKARLDSIRQKSEERKKELERRMLKVNWLLGEHMY